ncbi:MAG: hypothetical protein HZA36_03125 [Parcubacteria group bacterium]|nr:hypothetical protein [Parcubacteria group bacterium]
MYDYLLSCFEPAFISDSYASRIDKGQYKAINTFRYFIKLASRAHNTCYVLTCDVRKYFDTTDQNILFDIIKEKIFCGKVLKIIKEILSSYHSPVSVQKGIPLGNITSQIFANIYLNTLDQYVKKELKCRFYIRYNDDVVIVFENSNSIITTRDTIILFVKKNLLLDIPIQKTSIKKSPLGS